jgi:ribosomal protein S27AE
MSFGSEHGSVLSEIECPRCGAPAKIRAKKKEASHRVITNLVCEKCHLVKFAGMTSTRAIALERLRRTLMRKREKASTETQKQRIEGKLEEIEDKQKFKDLGIGG